MKYVIFRTPPFTWFLIILLAMVDAGASVYIWQQHEAHLTYIRHQQELSESIIKAFQAGEQSGLLRGMQPPRAGSMFDA